MVKNLLMRHSEVTVRYNSKSYSLDNVATLFVHAKDLLFLRYTIQNIQTVLKAIRGEGAVSETGLKITWERNLEDARSELRRVAHKFDDFCVQNSVFLQLLNYPESTDFLPLAGEGVVSEGSFFSDISDK